MYSSIVEEDFGEAGAGWGWDHYMMWELVIGGRGMVAGD